MKDLLKIMLVLSFIFISSFAVIKTTGLFTFDDIQTLLENAQQINPGYLALVVVSLLFADLFIAVPTMTVSIMAGYFLGWPLGFTATIGGFFLAGIVGYSISRIYGWRLLNLIYKDRERLSEMQRVFSMYGPMVLIICRAIPILPEVSCCMAGATRMSFYKFFAMYSLGSIPYALITTYAGSISSLDKPTPAIMAAMGVSLLLWLSWWVLARRLQKT